MSTRTLRSRAAKQASVKSLLPQTKTRQAGIQGFARASKASVGAGTTGAGKDVGTCLKKRKLEDVDVDEAAVEKRALRERKILQVGKAESNITPKDEAPTVCEAAAVLPEPPSVPETVDSEREEPATEEIPSANTKTSDEQQPQGDTRPLSYFELIALYSSFLGALSLHFAHNGITAPVDLREFLPNMERVWKKRKVTTEDIRRLLYVESNGARNDRDKPAVSFRLIDYGMRILLERLGSDKNGDNAPAFLNEDELNASFESSLDRVWLEKSAEKSDFDCMRHMPLAPIYKVPMAFLSIDQQKTSRIRGEIVRQKVPEKAGGSREKVPVQKSSATDRKNGLLERIKSKALRQSTLAPPVSKHTAMQRSAASRIPDIVNVLLLLSPSSSEGMEMSPSHVKKAYKLEAIVQNIRDSMRNPVAKEEISTSLHILARPEISGGWVTVVSTNSMKSVVLKSSRNVSPQDIKEKAAKMKI